MHIQGGSDEKHVGVPRVSHAAFVPLDTAAVDARAFGEAVLGEAPLASECGDPVAERYAPGVDPVGQRGSAAGHSTNRVGLSIMSQYPNGRLLAG